MGFHYLPGSSAENIGKNLYGETMGHLGRMLQNPSDRQRLEKLVSDPAMMERFVDNKWGHYSTGQNTPYFVNPDVSRPDVMQHVQRALGETLRADPTKTADAEPRGGPDRADSDGFRENTG